MRATKWPKRLHVCIDDAGELETNDLDTRASWRAKHKEAMSVLSFTTRADAAEYCRDTNEDFPGLPPLRVATYALVDEKPATKKARKR